MNNMQDETFLGKCSQYACQVNLIVYIENVIFVILCKGQRTKSGGSYHKPQQGDHL